MFGFLCRFCAFQLFYKSVKKRQSRYAYDKFKINTKNQCRLRVRGNSDSKIRKKKNSKKKKVPAKRKLGVTVLEKLK